MPESPSVASAPPGPLLRLADTKYLLGRRLSEWTNRAPALEAAVAAAAMAQDELGHARSVYAALQSTPDAPEAYLSEQGRAQPLGAACLERPFQHWSEFVAAVALFDRAMTVVFEGMHRSKNEPMRQRAGKILQEEWFHWQYGQGWLKRLAAEPKTRPAMQAAVDQFAQATADWLATVGNGSMDQRVLFESAGDLRRRWLDEIGAVLSRCGLTLP